MSAPELPEHVQRNRRFWNRQAEEYLELGRRAWANDEPAWGIWRIPEAELSVLPAVAGKHVIELGCGTAYWSAWLARRGARVVGVDVSERQLANARTLQREHALTFPLIQASAESVPLVDASFDLALSEYGASIWCDPYRWVPEAARLLCRGGDLVFLKNSTLLMLCMPPDGTAAGERLARDYFGMHRFEWPDDDDVEFHLTHGDWVTLFRANGFVVQNLVEPRAPAGSSGRFAFVTPEWAQRWPSEEIWHVRKA